VANLDLENISGIGPSIKNKLNSIGVFNSRDLCFHLPVHYQDRTKVINLADAEIGKEVFIECNITSCQVLYRPRKMMMIKASDSSRSILIRFFILIQVKRNNLEQKK